MDRLLSVAVIVLLSKSLTLGSFSCYNTLLYLLRDVSIHGPGRYIPNETGKLGAQPNNAYVSHRRELARLVVKCALQKETRALFFFFSQPVVPNCPYQFGLPPPTTTPLRKAVFFFSP